MNNLEGEQEGEEERQDQTPGRSSDENVWWMNHLKFDEVPTANRYGPLQEEDEETLDREYPKPSKTKKKTAVRAPEEVTCAPCTGLPMFWQSVEELEKEKENRCCEKSRSVQDPTDPVRTSNSIEAPSSRKKRSYKPLLYFDKEATHMKKVVIDSTLNALGKPGDDCQLVEGIVDSGAVNSVTNKTSFDADVKPSEMSRSGRRYRGPDGSRIPNYGQQEVEFAPDEGH